MDSIKDSYFHFVLHLYEGSIAYPTVVSSSGLLGRLWSLSRICWSQALEP